MAFVILQSGPVNLDAATVDLLWRNALVATPVALVAAVVGRVLPCRPSTRHGLWVMVLLSFILPAAAPTVRWSALRECLPDTALAGWRSIAPGPDPAAPLPAVDPREALRSGQQERRASRHPSTSDAAPPVSTVPAQKTPVRSDESRSPLLAQQHRSPVMPFVPAPSGDRRHSPATAGSEPPGVPAVSEIRAVEPSSGPTLPSAPGAGSFSFSSTAATTLAACREWMERLAAVREALFGIPPVPIGIWLGGIVILLVLSLIRWDRFRKVLHESRSADRATRDLVQRVAEELRLRRAPLPVMTAERLSPMIWCGRPMRLVLPIGLWSELDDLGRRAVLTHELAHLRRHDHWVCWIQALVGVLYWWHPVAWWCRRRLREEADHSCDTWVTTLLPASRRAYAQALLATRSYISDFRCPAPAVGLGATTPHAKRFARRLTMVMTQSTAPKMSRWAAASLAVLAAAAWLTTPLWACPPEEEAARKQVEKELKAKARAPRAVIVQTPAPPRVPAPELAPDGASTYERHMRERTNEEPGSAMHRRMEELERRLDRIAEQLERYLQQRIEHTPGARGPGAAVGGWAGMTPAPMPPMPPGEPVVVAPGGGDTVVREYRIPEGKREALWALMARSDVPVLVESSDRGIMVHATPQQHEAFRSFIELIHPAGGSQSNAGTLPASEAMWRSALEAAVAGQSRSAEAARAAEEAIVAAAARMAGGRSGYESKYVQVALLQQQAEHLAQQASHLESQAEEVEARAEELENQAESAPADQRERLLAAARDLMARAGALQSEAEAMQARADEMDAEVEALHESLEEEAEAAADDGEVE